MEEAKPLTADRVTLTVSPNPARSFVLVNAPRSLSGAGELSLYDASGKLARTLPVRNSQSGVRIPLAGLQPGAYLCRLQTGPGPASCRLLVVR